MTPGSGTDDEILTDMLDTYLTYLRANSYPTERAEEAIRSLRSPDLWAAGIWYGGDPERDCSEVFDDELSPSTVVWRTREAVVAYVESELRDAVKGIPYFLEDQASRMDQVDVALEARDEVPGAGDEVRTYWNGDVCRVRGTEEMTWPPQGCIARVRVEG